MQHNRKISVVGLGYVGLPVAVAFGKQASVIGFDINSLRIAELKRGYDRTLEVDSGDLGKAHLQFTDDQNDLKASNFFIITVPTPINKDKKPDLGMLYRASEIVGKNLSKNAIVVYESTVYPGVTEEECLPLLEHHSGLRAGKDFYVGYSPERINPGDKEHRFTAIMKVVAAQDEDTLDIIAAVYGSVVEAGIFRAPSIKVAEAAKVIENTQRDLNIALMNELSIIFDKLDIDTNDVIETASTKWNFLPFRPGLVGGHCIGVDPHYLTHRAKLAGHVPEVILSGRNINDGMGKYVARKVIDALLANNKNVNECLITILGFTFKEDIPDTRNTTVIDIVNELTEQKISVQLNDVLADRGETQSNYGIQIMDHKEMSPSDAVILAVAHKEYVEGGWKLITGLLKQGGIVFDVKGILDRNSCPESVNLIRL